MYLGHLWHIVAAATLAVAAPSLVVPRDVSSEVLGQFTRYAQWAAAAYCSNNLDSTGDAITCADDYCPEVDSSTTVSLSEFNESNDFGDTAGFVAADKTNEQIVVAFRGSSSISNWIANLDFVLTDASSLCDGCEAHMGFLECWETVADSITFQVESAMQTYSGYTLVVTGHSLGGAIAAIGATALRNAGYTLDLYTFGQPRIGNLALATYLTEQGNNRITHLNDIVPRLPPILLGFHHSSPEYWITSGDDVMVTTSDIDVIDGIDSLQGNAGELIESVAAHAWYIIDIDGCS